MKNGKWTMENLLECGDLPPHQRPTLKAILNEMELTE